MSLAMTMINKLSPYGHQGRVIHALQTCQCGRCEGERVLRMETEGLDGWREDVCLMENIAKEETQQSLSFNNSLWLFGSGFVQQGNVNLQTVLFR